jgi:hypothetical protein
MLVFGQADRLSKQSCADVDHVAVQPDLAVVTDPAHVVLITGG